MPEGWNQWPKWWATNGASLFFLGDLPHAWVASDYVRSVLDMFAYERESDGALVIAAGVPDAWLDAGIAVGQLRTPYGKLSYTLHREQGATRQHFDAGLQLPVGGIVFQLPGTGKPERVVVGGTSSAWKGGELRVRRLPAEIVMGSGE